MDTIFTVARDVGISLRKGVLAYLTGPNFETRAELKVLKMFGADAVGWSMVPEVLEARRMGMEVLGIVCISDMSDPDALNAVDLDELYRLGEERTESLLKLLVALLERI
jgi:purine-nucleoside phosphorylase